MNGMFYFSVVQLFAKIKAMYVWKGKASWKIPKIYIILQVLTAP